MKKVSLLILVSLILLLAFTSCDMLPDSVKDLLGQHEHEWSDATCEAPKTCACGETEGEALGHDWTEATCTSAKTCKTCNATEGEAAGHTWASATCTTPKTCKDCGTTSGKANGHTWEAADCTSPKTCKDCGVTEDEPLGHKYTYDCDVNCSVCGQFTRPDAKHDIQHVDGTEPTCTETGLKEYWYCASCDVKWLNAAHTVTFEDDSELVLEIIEHYYFYECDQYCMGCGELTNPEAVHSIQHVDAVEPTCTEFGNIEYWYCDYCGVCYDNEEFTGIPTNRFMVILSPEHKYFYECDPVCMVCYELTNEEAAHSVVHVEAKDATCTEDGNIEYWYCEYCNSCYDNEEFVGIPLNKFRVIIPAAHTYFYECDPVCMVCYELTNPEAAHSVVHVEAKDPTCTENGNIEYWYCEYCNSCYDNEEFVGIPLNRFMVIIPAAHTYFYECDKVCSVCFELTNEEAAHSVIHVDAKAPNCTELGNIEYWYCEYCGTCYDNAEFTGIPTNKMSVILPTVHEYVYDCDTNCKLCGEETRPEAKHDYADATCDVAATCTICGVSSGDAIGHDWSEYVADGNATCEADGTKTRTCQRTGCGEKETVADVDSALGHSYTNYESNGDAKCEEDGTKTATCDNGCGKTDTVADEGSALDHSYTNYESNDDATCEEDGTKTATCDHGCGKTDTVVDEESALGHDFVYAPNGDATCQGGGTKSATCGNGCGATSTVADPDTVGDHNWTAATCSAPKTCSVCLETEGESAGPLAHALSVSHNGVIATYACAHCDYSFTAETGVHYDGNNSLGYISAPLYNSTVNVNGCYEVIRNTDDGERGQAQIWLPGNNKDKGLMGFSAANQSIGYISFSLSTKGFKNRPQAEVNGTKKDMFDMFSVELADFTFGDNYDVDGDGKLDNIRWSEYWAIPDKAFFVRANDEGNVYITGYKGIDLGTYTPGTDGWTEWIDVAMGLDLDAAANTLTVHYYIGGAYVGSSTVEHTTLGKAITNIYLNANVVDKDAGYKIDDIVFGYTAHHHDMTPTIAGGMVTYNCDCGMNYMVSSEYHEWDGEGTDSSIVHSPNGAINRQPIVNADGTWGFMFTPSNNTPPTFTAATEDKKSKNEQQDGWFEYEDTGFPGGQFQPWFPSNAKRAEYDGYFTDFSCEENAVGIISFRMKSSIVRHKDWDTSITFSVGKPRGAEDWDNGGSWSDDSINIFTVEETLASGVVLKGGLNGTNLNFTTIPVGEDGWSEWFDVTISIALTDDGWMHVYYYINGVFVGSDSRDLNNPAGNRTLNPKKIEALQISGWTYAANTGIMFDDFVFGYTAGGHNTLDGKVHTLPADATCDKEATCSCGWTGYTVPHDFAKATCTAPATCKGCGLTSGEKIDHSIKATYDKDYRCTTYSCDTCDNTFVADNSAYFDGTGASGHFSTNNTIIKLGEEDGAFKVYSSDGTKVQYMWFLPHSSRTDANILKDFSCENNSVGVVSFKFKTSSDDTVKFVLMEARNNNPTWDADGSWTKNSIDVLYFNKVENNAVNITNANFGGTTIATVSASDGWSEWIDVQLYIFLKSDNTLTLTYVINGVNCGTVTRDLANPGSGMTLSDYKIECAYFNGYTSKAFMVDDFSIGYTHNGHWTFDDNEHNVTPATCSNAASCSGCAWTAPRLDNCYYAPSYADGVTTYTCAGCGNYYQIEVGNNDNDNFGGMSGNSQNAGCGFSTSSSDGLPVNNNGVYEYIKTQESTVIENGALKHQLQMWLPKDGKDALVGFNAANNAKGFLSFSLNSYMDTLFEMKLVDSIYGDNNASGTRIRWGAEWCITEAAFRIVPELANSRYRVQGWGNGSGYVDLKTISVTADNMWTGWMDVSILIEFDAAADTIICHYYIDGELLGVGSRPLTTQDNGINSVYVNATSATIGSGYMIKDIAFGYTTKGLQERAPLYNSVVDAENVTSDTLKTIRLAKIKQLDQVNADSTRDAEAAATAKDWYSSTNGTPVYVLANDKDGNEVEALYFSRTKAWFNASRSGEEYGMASFRFVLNTTASTISFDYLIRGVAADLGHLQMAKTNTKGESIVLDGNAYMEVVIDGTYYTFDEGTTFITDGEWHTMTFDLGKSGATFTEFLFNLYHFEGEMLVANLKVAAPLYDENGKLRVEDIAAEDVTAEALKTFNAAKIKQYDQANAAGTDASKNDDGYFEKEGGTPRYVKVAKGFETVEAVYLSRFADWTTHSSASQNSLQAEHRYSLDSTKKVASISFDYILNGTVGVHPTTGEGIFQIKLMDGSKNPTSTTGNQYWDVDFGADTYIEDGQWHHYSYTMETPYELECFLIILREFQGEFVLANLVVTYAD